MRAYIGLPLKCDLEASLESWQDPSTSRESLQTQSCHHPACRALQLRRDSHCAEFATVVLSELNAIVSAMVLCSDCSRFGSNAPCVMLSSGDDQWALHVACSRYVSLAAPPPPPPPPPQQQQQQQQQCVPSRSAAALLADLQWCHAASALDTSYWIGLQYSRNINMLIKSGANICGCSKLITRLSVYFTFAK